MPRLSSARQASHRRRSAAAPAVGVRRASCAEGVQRRCRWGAERVQIGCRREVEGRRKETARVKAGQLADAASRKKDQRDAYRAETFYEYSQWRHPPGPKGETVGGGGLVGGVGRVCMWGASPVLLWWRWGGFGVSASLD
jgi:hypothetical protein